MKDIMIFLVVMMLLCAGALYLKNQAGLEEKAAQRPMNPTVTVLEKEVAAVKTIEKPVIDPKTDPLAPVATTAPTYKPAPTPAERYDPAHMVQ